MWNVLSFNSLPYTDETISNTESEDRIWGQHVYDENDSKFVTIHRSVTIRRIQSMFGFVVKNVIYLGIMQ
jgi:hypothetical protein